jgi:hypothetical protein
MDMVHFQFEGMALKEACWMSGKPYFTGRAIGEFLEYANPGRDINRIVQRNSHINDPRWSVVAKLATTDGKKYSIRIYDPIGLQLIIFESQQPKAIQFKIAAAHLVHAYMTGELKPSKWVMDHDLVAASKQIMSLPHGRKRAALIRDLAEHQDCSLATAYRRIERATGSRLKTIRGKAIRHKDNAAAIKN